MLTYFTAQYAKYRWFMSFWGLQFVRIMYLRVQGKTGLRQKRAKGPAPAGSFAQCMCIYFLYFYFNFYRSL
ncbi:hypothetical protein BDZ91DRAFT_711078 [Kalaharituber pfeilii]|nr:hypothetical protein BDZ91DRAFT_711078 [Kalaharituber pfeilii]